MNFFEKVKYYAFSLTDWPLAAESRSGNTPQYTFKQAQPLAKYSKKTIYMYRLYVSKKWLELSSREIYTSTRGKRCNPVNPRNPVIRTKKIFIWKVKPWRCKNLRNKEIQICDWKNVLILHSYQVFVGLIGIHSRWGFALYVVTKVEKLRLPRRQASDKRATVISHAGPG